MPMPAARSRVRSSVLLVVIAAAALATAAIVAPRARAQLVPVTTDGPYTGVPGQPIVMTGTVNTVAVGVFQWVWSFGDGSSAFGQSVQKVYSAPGTYTVTLSVQTAQGFASTMTTATVVGQGPTIQISAGGPYFGVAGQPITMSALGLLALPGAQLVWNFGDGTTGLGQTVQKTYAVPGVYTVTVLIQTTTAVTGALTAGTTATVSAVGTAAPAAVAATAAVSLAAGCTNVISTWPNGTAPGVIVSAVAPLEAVIALWRLTPGTQQFQGYAPNVTGVNDLLAVDRFDALFVCTTGPATLARPS